MRMYVLKEYFTEEMLQNILQGVKHKIEVELDDDIQIIDSFTAIGDNPLDFNSDEKIYLLKLCRLFMGNLVLHDIDTDESLPQLPSVFQNMFVTNDLEEDDEYKVVEMIDFIIEFSKCTEENKIQNLLDSEFRNNREFYKNISTEIQQFVTYQSRKSYLTAFVHLYRTYEYMSYAFPLTYIHNTSDFYDSYDQLRKFFHDTNSAELAFFSRFLNEVFLENDYISDELYGQNFEISFQTSNYDDIKRTLHPIVTLVNNKTKKVNKDLTRKGFPSVDNVINFDDETSSLNIQILVFHDFIIELRNKIFHFKASRRDSIMPNNIYFEEIFEILNIHIYNWIAMIFKFILHSALENHER
ncbi:hypothetical protein [Exiguobacterium sp. s131]|uniref:hypothetical protein n=1 Tax=Exiguobacterium sp. s131 TaxID=2751278 RepID=UPI001BE63018|nr:hypothetical protein [Exiguobacterium sp. s131]